LDVVANKNYIEAKDTPNSDLKVTDIRKKSIRFRAMQALGKAPEGDMILRVSKRAADNGAVSDEIETFAKNVDGFKTESPSVSQQEGPKHGRLDTY